MGSQSDGDADGSESLGSETTCSQGSEEYSLNDRLAAFGRILDLPQFCLATIAGVDMVEGGLDSSANPEEDVEGAASQHSEGSIHESPEQENQENEDQDQEDHQEESDETLSLSDFLSDDDSLSDLSEFSPEDLGEEFSPHDEMPSSASTPQHPEDLSPQEPVVSDEDKDPPLKKSRHV